MTPLLVEILDARNKKINFAEVDDPATVIHVTVFDATSYGRPRFMVQSSTEKYIQAPPLCDVV